MFRLKAPEGWYVIQLLPGCDYCSIGPGIEILHPGVTDCIPEFEELPDLPVVGPDTHPTSLIKCGLTPEEAESAAIKCFKGTPLEPDEGVDEDGLYCPIDRIDESLAEILGADFWKMALTKRPEVVFPIKDED